MRTEAEILSLLQTFILADDRIRSALLTGSRANPAHRPDALSDFDVLCFVADPDSFAADESWMGVFGRVLVMQRPDNPPPCRTWLVIFHDGVRIDFTFAPLAMADPDGPNAAGDLAMARLLVDKDGRLSQLSPPSESAFYPHPPVQEEFAACVNEFWWVLLYVAKGLWRNQPTYARHAMERTVRPEMEKLLVWYIGCTQGWRFNPGAAGKYLGDLLPAELWQAYLQTFAGYDASENWQAIRAAAELVTRVAPEVAMALGYAWDEAEAANARSLVETIHRMPRIESGRIESGR